MVTTDQDTPRHQQITTHLRHQILTGEFLPGHALPTMHQLAEQYETSYFTVQTALTPLVAEGLIERKRRVGTIVRHHADVLTCAAIYCGCGMLGDREFAFYRELVQQLQEQLQAENIQADIFIDTRPDAQQTEPLPALLQAVESHRVQGLLVTLCDQETMAWLRKLPVAMSFSTSAKAHDRVAFDNDQLFRQAVDCLCDQGCRRLGIVSSVHRSAEREFSARGQGIYQSFVEMIHARGLEHQAEWLRVPERHIHQLEAYGYAQLHALWALPERPDGLIVYPDVVARGVMTAVLELGIAVPDELRMVLHRNSGVDWVCPMPVTWAISDVAMMARAMIAQVRAQKAGESSTEQILPYHFNS